MDDLENEARALQQEYLIAEKALVFFRDIMADKERSPLLVTAPEGLSAEQLEAWRERGLRRAMDEAESLAKAWLARYPQKIHEFLIGQGAEVSFLGFESKHPILPGERAIVFSVPQVQSFLPIEVCIPDEIAPSFSIESIQSGNKSCFLSSNPVPASAFIRRRLACRVKFPPVFLGMVYTWIVRNTGKAPLIFSASFKGPFLT